jgi:hypothetical protein
MLFGLYNMSLYGNFIAILPPIHLSLAIHPDAAKQLRHPQEELKAKEEEAEHSVEGLRNALVKSIFILFIIFRIKVINFILYLTRN